jgi:hypothetical protein
VYLTQGLLPAIDCNMSDCVIVSVGSCKRMLRAGLIFFLPLSLRRTPRGVNLLLATSLGLFRRVCYTVPTIQNTGSCLYQCRTSLMSSAGISFSDTAFKDNFKSRVGCHLTCQLLDTQRAGYRVNEKATRLLRNPLLSFRFVLAFDTQYHE